MPDSSATPTQVVSLSASDPRTIGSYRPVGRLGVGGMGVVYLAQSQDGHHVALKVVRSELANEPQFRVRFAREVQAARAVGGHYTAHLVDADTEATPQWIATEFIPGPTLADHVETHGALPEDQVRLLGLGLAEAIEAIAAAGLIHRDLKPSNVILSAEGPKVIDFGISQAVDATSLTQTGVYVGSLAWMSPEQVTGDALSPKTDVFSLGLLLAYAALGRHPFGEGRPEAVAFRMVNQAPALGDLPPSLRALCGRLLSKTPSDRPSPAAVVFALTDGATQFHDITRVMDGRWDATVAGDPPTIPPVPDATQAAAAPRRKGRRGLAVALAGATTVAAATAAAVALGAIPLPIGGDVNDAGAAAIASPSVAVEPSEEPEASAEANSTPTSTDQPNDTPDRYPLLVDTTLTVRSGPYLDAEAIGQLSASDTVLIECTTRGDPVQETDTIVNDQWNRITAPVDGWVADAYVDTGALPATQPPCSEVPLETPPRGTLPSSRLLVPATTLSHLPSSLNRTKANSSGSKPQSPLPDGRSSRPRRRSSFLSHGRPSGMPVPTSSPSRSTPQPVAARATTPRTSTFNLRMKVMMDIDGSSHCRATTLLIPPTSSTQQAKFAS